MSEERTQGARPEILLTLTIAEAASIDPRVRGTFKTARETIERQAAEIARLKLIERNNEAAQRTNRQLVKQVEDLDDNLEAAEAEARQLREQLQQAETELLHCRDSAGKVEDLERKLAACERDAARYRRIRNVPSLTMANGWFRGTTDLDDAVDAAMSAKEDK